MATFHPIDDVVDVIISLGDRPITLTSFDTAIILTAHNLYTDRAREYTAASDLLDDNFASGSNVYKMAQDLFSGAFAPKTVVIGRRDLTRYEVDFDVANTEAYTLVVKVDTGSTVFNKTFTVTSDANATASEIAAAFVVDIEADGDIGAFVAAVDATGTLTLTPESTGLVSVGASTDNMEISTISGETVDTALSAIEEVNNNWFFLLSDSHTETDIKALAAYAEANKVMYVGSTEEATVWTSSTTDLLSDLAALEYDNTHIQASKDSDKEFPEAAVVGAWAGTNPGSSTLYGKTLKGVSVQDFSTSEMNFVKGKNGNVYINRGGSGFYEPGKQVSGRYSDIIRGILWLEARMEEDVFGFLKRKSDAGQKIPYTATGIDMIATVMKSRLSSAVSRGLLESYQVFAPKIDDISTNDKANRTLADIPFEATLAGAIHTITIRGYVSV